jgi:hypothetical protein
LPQRRMCKRKPGRWRNSERDGRIGVVFGLGWGRGGLSAGDFCRSRPQLNFYSVSLSNGLDAHRSVQNCFEWPLRHSANSAQCPEWPDEKLKAASG